MIHRRFLYTCRLILTYECTHTHTSKQTNTSAYMHGLKHTQTRTHAHSHRCVYAQSSLVPRSPMKKCQVPFDRYRNGLHVSSTSRPKVCIVISVKKLYDFLWFRIECTHADSYTDLSTSNLKIGQCLHTHTQKFNAPGKYYPLQGKKILCQCLFLLHFFPLFCMVWSKRKSEHSSQTNEKSNLWFTLQRPFHYDLRRRQCK